MNKQAPTITFDTVRTLGLVLPEVEARTNWAGIPVLKVRRRFMAGLASHRSAESVTLVVRYTIEERGWLLDNVPDTYYLTDYCRPYPRVLVRLSRLNRDALRDLLSVSWRMAMAKTRASPLSHRSASSLFSDERTLPSRRCRDNRRGDSSGT